MSKEIGANHFKIDVRCAMFALAASIGAESVRLQVIALRERILPEETNAKLSIRRRQ
jgi:sialic acid synthase SpsE